MRDSFLLLIVKSARISVVLLNDITNIYLFLIKQEFEIFFFDWYV